MNQRFISHNFLLCRPSQRSAPTKCHPRWQPTRRLAVSCGLGRRRILTRDCRTTVRLATTEPPCLATEPPCLLTEPPCLSYWATMPEISQYSLLYLCIEEAPNSVFVTQMDLICIYLSPGWNIVAKSSCSLHSAHSYNNKIETLKSYGHPLTSLQIVGKYYNTMLINKLPICLMEPSVFSKARRVWLEFWITIRTECQV